MNDMVEILTSTECIVVYAITFVLCLTSFLIYKFDNNKQVRRKKQNTRELNKLLEDIEDIETFDDYDYNQVPKLETIDNYYDNKDAVIDKLAPTKKEIAKEGKEVSLVEEMVTETINEEPVIEPKKMQSEINLKVQEPPKEELEYTSIEPDQEEARKELLSLTKKLEMDELKKEQFFNEVEEEPVIEEVNSDLTKYEEEQEMNSIISLEELNNKSKEIIESNEINQYKDEGNEPISLHDLETKMNKQLEIIAENFEINKVADEPSKEEITEMLDGTETKKMKMDDFNSIKTRKYHPSPVISPIFGLEKNSNVDLELENTADYDKLDQEIKKTNEFLMTLKELQEHTNN